jgi:hypothetical protein
MFSTMYETDGDMLWNGSEADRNVRSVGKMKALTLKRETVTVIGKGRICYALCIKCMKLTVNYFFLPDVSCLGVALDLDK